MAATKMQKLAVIALLLALTVSGGEAAGSAHKEKPQPADKFLECSHSCDDQLAVCIANKCVPLPLGKPHNYCHVGCEASHVVCLKKCMKQKPEE